MLKGMCIIWLFIVYTELYIYVFITIISSIPLLVDCYSLKDIIAPVSVSPLTWLIRYIIIEIYST